MAGKPVSTKSTLGLPGAKTIVSNCADSTNWNTTCNQLPIPFFGFRNCLTIKVQEAGFVPPQIAGDGNSTLWSFVMQIRDSPHQ